jgi:hypothetical protein
MASLCTHKKWLQGIGLQTALKEDAAEPVHNTGKLSAYRISSISILKRKATEDEYIVAKLVGSGRDSPCAFRNLQSTSP